MSELTLDQEISVIAQVNGLPANMKLIYMNLVSAMEKGIADLESEGARSDHIKETFVEALINTLVEKPMSQHQLTAVVKNEIQRQLARTTSVA